MNFLNSFDAVIMLTWSDWKTEPRSNRYHYATRFARTVPVLFLQHQSVVRSGLSVESTEVPNLDIVNVSVGISGQEIAALKQLLHARGIRRPLLWVYDSMNYQPLLDALPAAFRVYHATEDYLTKSDGWGGGWSSGKELIAQSVVRVLEQVDFMVACTEGVANSYLTAGGYCGRYAVVENGCDAEYFLDYAQKVHEASIRSKPPVAIFQGGINSRLDYALMHALIRRMPTWDFWFCGNAVESDVWSSLLKLPNVKYHGALEPDKFAQLMCESTAGIITYIQDEWIRNSLPLKAYEYVACGLPVVTVPITALERDPDLMAIATTPAEFEVALLAAAKSRFDPALMQRRRESALARSYNARFESMCRQLQEAVAAKKAQDKQLKLAVLYDSVGSMHVSTIQQHLDAFGKYSNHAVTYVPATPIFWNSSPENVQRMVDFSYFDAVVVHYSVRMSIREHLDEGLARALESFNGFKVLFIQDEYEGTEIARQWMDRLQFSLVYTCVPESGREQVYPSYRFPGTEFLPTLTGYIPENSAIEQYAQPMAQRQLLIAYRGRKLPAVYGDLGYEKYRIGTEMKRLTAALGVAADIEVEDSKRIYGAAWYQFLGSSRATLGTESGANVFDFDGSLKTAIAKLEAQNPSISYEEISAKLLSPYDGLVRMNQISPKVFEAICLRTALVLFEGTYSNVVLPEVHFFALKKDFSNAEEIIRKLQDTALVQAMTERAYRDVVASGKYSYQSFIHAFDADIEARIPRGNRLERLNGPLYFAGSDNRPRQALPTMPAGLLLGARDSHWKLSDFAVEHMAEMAWHNGNPAFSGLQSGQEPLNNSPSAAYLALQKMWHVLPFGLRVKLARRLGKLVRFNQSAARPKSLFFQIACAGWHLLPLGIRIRLARILERG